MKSGRKALIRANLQVANTRLGECEHIGEGDRHSVWKLIHGLSLRWAFPKADLVETARPAVMAGFKSKCTAITFGAENHALSALRIGVQSIVSGLRTRAVNFVADG